MQQRTKRLAIIWAKTFASFIATCAGILVFALVLKMFPEYAQIVIISTLALGGIGYVTFNIAKLRLDTEERDQARILRSLSKGYDE